MLFPNIFRPSLFANRLRFLRQSSLHLWAIALSFFLAISTNSNGQSALKTDDHFSGPLDQIISSQEHFHGALNLVQPNKKLSAKPLKYSRTSLSSNIVLANSKMPTQPLSSIIPGYFEAYGFSNMKLEENPPRPAIEERTVEPSPQRPSFEKPQSVMFEGTFEEFEEANVVKTLPPTVQTPPQKERNYRPTLVDYRRHGLVGYGDLGYSESGYLDGQSFGYSRNRLYHPLEGPTTDLIGLPTLPQINTCYCDQWAGFCNFKQLNYVYACGGLKMHPGHLGLKWLGSKENCDQTEPLFPLRKKVCRR